MKDSLFLDICRNEYNVLIKMIHKAISLCSENLWNKEIDEPPFWQQVYHTIYYLDFYLGDSPETHKERFDVKENLNERTKKILSKQELKSYLTAVRKKCNKVLDNLTSKELEGENSYYWTGPTLAHRLVYNIRHGQHHIGRLNSILRRHEKEAVKWIITV